MTDLWSTFLNYFEKYGEIIQLAIIILITFFILTIILRVVKRRLLKKIKTKKQMSNVTVFIDLLKFIFAIFFVIIIFSIYYGDLGDLGFVAGLLTVALGWALQKPISGVVAWLILITRRPFHISDRISIAGIKGDVTNITLTHIILDEVGGTIDGEEKSGRIVMIPNSDIFEKEVINYTHQDDYILDEIITAITYESDLKKAEALIIRSVENIMVSHWMDFPKKISKVPHTRLKFKDSGIDISVRYYTLADRRNEISTNIRREIFNQIRETPEVEFAYPHAEVLLRERKVKA